MPEEYHITPGQDRASSVRGKLPAGTPIEVEHDVQARDRRGRLLAYVWTPDGTLVNLVLVREGYAQVHTVPPNVWYRATLLACQREAREARHGLWGQP